MYGVQGIRKYCLQYANMYGIYIENTSAGATVNEDLEFELDNYVIVDHESKSTVSVVVPPGVPCSHHLS